MRPRQPRQFITGLIAPGAALLLTAGAAGSALADTQTPTGPTAESALAAEQDLARAFRNNDADGISRWLSDDWEVIATSGGVGEGKTIFPEGIKTGVLTRKTFDISESRVRLYGKVAVVTNKVNTSGVYHGKPFDIWERQTDVLLWKHGGWKVVLTQESGLPAAEQHS
ncbi:MAG: nuclear transport factor 2 family protein [Steroidobacteraceae bacterium]